MIDIFHDDDFDGYGGPKWDKNLPIVPWGANTWLGTSEGMLSYAEWSGRWDDNSKRLWALIEPFESKMQLVSEHKGRSAMNFIMRADNGFEYPLPLSDFMWLVKNDTMTKGLSESHKWFAKKRGGNYFLGIEGVSKP